MTMVVLLELFSSVPSALIRLVSQLFAKWLLSIFMPVQRVNTGVIWGLQ